MKDVEALRSGKTHRDENFPVARLVSARHREAILGFYDFVRTADDVADHPDLSPEQKLASLDALEDALIGRDEAPGVGTRLRAVLEDRSLSDRHARDLLSAFRQDVRVSRYRTWDELIDYCALSAMPVGRYVLDVHGESAGAWIYSDPLCAALQIINHLQDCATDHRRLDRVYLPLDALAAAGAEVRDLSAPQSSPALRACLRDLARRTLDLVAASAPLPGAVEDGRLAMECAAIHRLAETLARRLENRDPLSERVHLGKPAFLSLALVGALSAAVGRVGRRRRSALPTDGRRA